MVTVKQKRAFKKVVENGGNVSKAMKAVGYSSATAQTPQKLTQSDGWKELMNQFLPDHELAKKHKQLLNAVSLERLSFDENTTDEDIEEAVGKMEGYKLIRIVSNTDKDGHLWSKYAYVKAPDNMAQDKALDKAYKLKGSYAAEKHVNVNIEVSPEVRGKSKKAIGDFLKVKT